MAIQKMLKFAIKVQTPESVEQLDGLCSVKQYSCLHWGKQSVAIPLK